MQEIPRWGRVTAEPHEYLIQIKNGRVKAHGQGISVFKWPSDSIAIMPTSIAKLSFSADQVTLEKVGVEVRGLAVYRIVEPLLAYRMIDTDRGALTDILRDMFVGATRRIVASLTLDECLTHRKERVGAALMSEISPVLAGEGSASDATHAGWGVVLDTIEIQDVKVLSQEVFSRLQAPFREQLALKALQAKDELLREEARLAADRDRAMEQAARELMVEQETRLFAERRRDIESGAHHHQIQSGALQSDLLRMQQRAEADRTRALVEMQTKREAQEMEIALERERRSIRQDLTEAQLSEIMLTQTLPALATAFRGSFDRVNVTAGDGAQLFGFLTAGVDQVLEMARKNGVQLPAFKRPT